MMIMNEKFSDVKQIENLLTPYKYGKPILAPSGEKGTFDCYGVDNARIFRHNGKIYMFYIGFDGQGYHTALATSEDMINWKKLGIVFGRDDESTWEKGGKAISCVFEDKDLYGNRELKKINGKYWMMYHAYPYEGYEQGPAANGLAWSTDENLLEWHCLKEPVFTHGEKGQWDQGGLYSTWVVCEDDGFKMYYNGKSHDGGFPWLEQVGVAYSKDMINWTRYENNPVLSVSPHDWDCFFSCGQHVLYDSKNKRWVMFYCGYDGKHAMDGVAISDDGILWKKYSKSIIPVGKQGEIDETHAHKPCVFWHNGVLYHIYCAVRPTKEDEKEKYGHEFRCLTIAASVPFDKA